MSWKNKFPNKNRFFETDNGILYYGDCVNIMEDMLENTVDLILTDPPYGVNSNEKNGIDYKDLYFNVNKCNELFFKVLKNNTRLFMFIAQKTLCKTIQEMKNFNLHQILIWHKPNFASGGKRTYDFTNAYEFIINFHKDKPSKIKRVNDVNKDYQANYDVLKYTQPQSNYKKDKRYHIHQKPLKLIEHLILSSTEENDIVLDAFSGSGTVALACEKYKRKWIAIEINQEYCEITKNRIEKYLKEYE